MRHLRRLSCAAAAIALTACASVPSAEVADDGARFDRFKALAGEWTATGQGDAPDGSKVSYRVTAAGSAVVETVFVGSPHEMVTVYRLDGGRLRLTHYCALGNQPGMVALPGGGAADVVEFDLDQLGNGDPSRDAHMHHAKFEFLSPDRLKTSWTMWKAGKAEGAVTIDLARSTKPDGTR
jgi:hypothetical protein